METENNWGEIMKKKQKIYVVGARLFGPICRRGIAYGVSLLGLLLATCGGGTKTAVPLADSIVCTVAYRSSTTVKSVPKVVNIDTLPVTCSAP